MEPKPRRIPAPAAASMGERIRGLRKHRELSLQQVSNVSGLSIGHLSQIERGLSSPSVDDLLRVSDALGVEMGSFFEGVTMGPDIENDNIVRLAERAEVSFHAGVIKQRLTPASPSPVNVYMLTLEPGGRSGETLYTHAGEEAGTVLQGRLHLTIDDRDYLLNEGDSFRFLSTIPHRFSNAFAAVTRVIWVNVHIPEDGQ